MIPLKHGIENMYTMAVFEYYSVFFFVDSFNFRWLVKTVPTRYTNTTELGVERTSQHLLNKKSSVGEFDLAYYASVCYICLYDRIGRRHTHTHTHMWILYYLAPQCCVSTSTVVLFVVAVRRNDVEHCRFFFQFLLVFWTFDGELFIVREIRIICVIFVDSTSFPTCLSSILYRNCWLFAIFIKFTLKTNKSG